MDPTSKKIIIQLTLQLLVSKHFQFSGKQQTLFPFSLDKECFSIFMNNDCFN